MKIVVAYSGGLDTSVLLKWLKEKYNAEIIAYCADVGQAEELDGLEEKALATGASKCFIGDLKEDFATNYIFPMMQANALYEGRYLLGTSIARPCISKDMVDLAIREGADAIAHGATGKGNDQVRFELAVNALAPNIKVIAPWRDPEFRRQFPGRTEMIAYAESHGIPIRQSLKKPYSMDRNLWHLSHEGHDLEDPWNAPQDDLYLICNTPEQAPNEAEYVDIEWEKGEPVAVNGEKLGPVELIEKLNALGAKHGVGIADMVENRLVGMKSRGVYETPAGTILYAAHMNLEELCLDRDTRHFKDAAAIRFAELVYFGQWYTPLRKALSAFVDSTQETMTGTTRVKLYKGSCTPAGTKSPYSLYSMDFATFDADDVYNQKDAGGFINCFGLPMKIRAMLLKDGEKFE